MALRRAVPEQLERDIERAALLALLTPAACLHGQTLGRGVTPPLLLVVMAQL
jgi:hypothetical protein